ncbi:FSCN1 [Lepeophtheirus salmonis]|uniref:Fascin n=1 Tax=Lepeophtheirus salmonis TaxID=72036 RepID=A0A7R8HB75_LEPSM|nr:FSCN1 [Lepeophtheirus salmonis]CAF2977068.1 FSCN1 [Lepeophtheirus salmonis]
MYKLESWGRPQLPPEGIETDEKGVSKESVVGCYGKTALVAAMTGVNGDTNGSNTNGTTSATDKGCWTIGLINSKYKYLSAETFGFRTNANGKALKKKQVWILEPSGNGESVVLRSHLNKYVAVDQFGNVTCDQEEKDETSKFEISVCDDQSGRWAFKSLSRGYFLGASSDNLICSAKSPGDAELWFVHLAARPQVNLKSIGRKRFAHLSENQEEIHVEENVPWGEDTLFTLEFPRRDGKLTSGLNKECFFSVEYHGGYIALRDYDGQYLSPIGSRAVLKTRSNSVTKDELFSLEDSLPQAAFVAVSNSKHVSVKQGVDVTANQDEISDYETFQMEYEQGSRRWYIRTMQDKYFTVQTGGGIQANENKRSPNAMFDVEWHTDGTISFKANNGKYVGFVGYKSTGSTKLECNKANYETIVVERSEKGLVHFKGQNGKYINARNDGLSADSDSPSGFYLELRDPTRMCIKSSDGQYLNSEKNGCLALTSTDIDEATQWEY